MHSLPCTPQEAVWGTHQQGSWPQAVPDQSQQRPPWEALKEPGWGGRLSCGHRSGAKEDTWEAEFLWPTGQRGLLTLKCGQLCLQWELVHWFSSGRGRVERTGGEDRGIVGLDVGRAEDQGLSPPMSFPPKSEVKWDSGETLDLGAPRSSLPDYNRSVKDLAGWCKN